MDWVTRPSLQTTDTGTRRKHSLTIQKGKDCVGLHRGVDTSRVEGQGWKNLVAKLVGKGRTGGGRRLLNRRQCRCDRILCRLQMLVVHLPILSTNIIYPWII